jgi:hypothetical protein
VEETDDLRRTDSTEAPKKLKDWRELIDRK